MTSKANHRHLGLVCVLFCACGSVSGLVSGKLPGGPPPLPSASAPPAPLAPKVEASANDPMEIKSIIRDLDTMEEGTHGKGVIVRFGALSQQIGQQLFYSDELEVKTSPKLRSLRDRYLAINKQLAQSAGGHAPEVMGDAMPPKKTPEGDGAQAAEDAVSACEQVKKRAGYNAESDQKEMAARYVTYEQKLARAKKVDPAALKYRAGAIAACELAVAKLRGANEDEYREEKPVVATDYGCGEMQFSARAVMMGGRPGIYERVAGSSTYPEKVDCKKIPSANKYPHELKPAVDDFLQGEATKAGGAIRFDGKYYTETDKEDLHVYKYAELTYLAKDMPFAANKCGGKDPKLACEASGSKTARALNEIEFYSARADVHRKAGRADACKRLLQTAYATYERWSKDYDDAQRGGKWVKGLTYKSHRGETLTDEQIVSRMKALGKAADDQALGGWCVKAG
jgi:hypothetical protein